MAPKSIWSLFRNAGLARQARQARPARPAAGLPGCRAAGLACFQRECTRSIYSFKEIFEKQVKHWGIWNWVLVVKHSIFLTSEQVFIKDD